MYCAISGIIASVPVVSSVSGLVYEKRLIVSALGASEAKDGVARCPVTNVEMTEADLVEIKSSAMANGAAKPRVVETTSIPAMLTMFQNEWDALALENAHLRKSLDVARRELAQHLYQYDAACRVIARLKKERDEAIARGGGTAASAPAPVPKSVPEVKDEEQKIEMPASDLKKICDLAKKLSKSRRKLPTPPDLAAPSDIKAWTGTRRKQISSPATCLDVRGDCFAVGCENGEVVLAERQEDGEINISEVRQPKSAGSAVKAVKLHPTIQDLLFTGSSDGTVEIWKAGACSGTIKHDTWISGIDVQATGDYVCTSSFRGDWKMADISSGRVLMWSKDARRIRLFCSHAIQTA